MFLILYIFFKCFLFSFFLQYVTEKMGGAEGTKLDLDFMEMERVSCSFSIADILRIFFEYS